MFIQNCIPYLWVIVDKTAVRENRLKFPVPVCEEETWRASGQGGHQMVPFWGGSAFDTTPRWRWPWSEPGSHRHRWWCLCTWSPCCPLLLRLPLLQEESKGLGFVRAKLSLTKSFSASLEAQELNCLAWSLFLYLRWRWARRTGGRIRSNFQLDRCTLLHPPWWLWTGRVPPPLTCWDYQSAQHRCRKSCINR